MADKSFGVKQVNLINASGTPRIESPNNLNINAVNVAISTDISVGGQLSLGTGTSISSPGSNILTLGTNSVERVRIESGGNIGIGTDFARTELDVRGDIWINRSSANGQPAHFSNPTQLLIQHTSAPNVYLIHGQYKTTIISGERLGAINFASNAESSGNGTPVVGASIVCEAQQSWTSSFNPGELIFRTNSGSSSSPSDAVGITSEGNIKFYRPGAGIDFSANSNAAGMTSELLDDYEEGTFDPIYRGGTTDGTPTYVTRVGRYVKIGQLVHLTIIVSGSITGASGQLEFGGMPFTPAEDAVGTFQANNAGSYASNVGQYSAYIGSGTNYMTFRGTKTDGTSHDNLSVRNVTYLRVSISFRVS